MFRKLLSRLIVLFAIFGLICASLLFFSVFHGQQIFNLPDFLYLSPYPKLALVLFWSEIISPFLSFVGENIETFLSWPVVVASAFFVIWSSKDFQNALAATVKRAKTLKFFGVEVDMDDKIAVLRKESDDLNKLIPEVRKSVTKEIKNYSDEAKIEDNFKKLVTQIFSYLMNDNSNLNPEHCRATIFVADPIFSGQLIQLLEYVSGDGKTLTGLNAGRSFSFRRGIVGRVWRSKIPEIAGVLPQTESTKSPEEKRSHIAQIWGLTISEAKSVEKYPSLIGIPFDCGSGEMAVLYIDSRDENAFLPLNDMNSESLSVVPDKLVTEVHKMIENLRIGNAICDMLNSRNIKSSRIETEETIDAT